MGKCVDASPPPGFVALIVGWGHGATDGPMGYFGSVTVGKAAFWFDTTNVAHERPLLPDACCWHLLLPRRSVLYVCRDAAVVASEGFVARSLGNSWLFAKCALSLPTYVELTVATAPARPSHWTRVTPRLAIAAPRAAKRLSCLRHLENGTKAFTDRTDNTILFFPASLPTGLLTVRLRCAICLPKWRC